MATRKRTVRRPRKNPPRTQHMTQRMAVVAFRQALGSRINQMSATDRRVAWVDYIDGLARDGLISEEQAYRWGNPFDRPLPRTGPYRRTYG